MKTEQKSKPGIIDGFIDEHNVMKTLIKYYDHRLPTLLIGEPGVGKTTLVELVAREKFARLTLKIGGDYSPSKLVGHHELQAIGGATNTQFVEGPLVRALKSGFIFYLDEIDTLASECQDILHPIIDHRRLISKADIGLPVAEGENETIELHENFWFVATCVSASSLPTDFMDRFRVIHVKRLSFQLQVKGLEDAYPNLSGDLIYRIAQIGEITLKLEWRKPISYRQLLNCLQDITIGIDVDVAIENNLVNPNADGVHDRLALSEAMQAAGLSDTLFSVDELMETEQFAVPEFDLDSLSAQMAAEEDSPKKPPK